MQKYWPIIAKIIFAALVIYFLTKQQLLNLTSLQLALNSDHILYIFLLIFIVVLIGAIRWFILLKSQNSTNSFTQCLYLYYIGYAFNYILPGGIAGDVIKIGKVVQSHNKKAVAALSVIIDRILGLSSMFLVILFFLPRILNKSNGNDLGILESKESITIYFAILLILIILSSTALIFLLNNKKIYKKLIRFLGKKKNQISKYFSFLLMGIFAYRKSGMVLLANIFMALITQIAVAACLMLIALSTITANINLIDYNLAGIAAQIMGIIPISPGGIGVSEATFAQLLYYLNDRTVLEYASIYLAFRLFNMLFSLPGIVVFFLQKRSVKKI